MTQPDFGGKILIIHKVQKCGQNDGFRLFLENGWMEFAQNAPESRTNQYQTARENRMSKFCSVLELFIHKVVIFGQNGQNEVQRSSNNWRTVNAMKNLIRYSESAENSLSVSLIFHQFHVFRV